MILEYDASATYISRKIIKAPKNFIARHRIALNY